jgi:Zn-dependent protease
MLGTTLTYSFFFGPLYSAGMVGLIFVHEAGHAIALKHYGVPFSPMVMIPFMGAAIATKEMPRNAWEDAVVAYAGPVTGTLGAVACTAGAGALDSQLLYALADFGYMINLFNLLPIGSMDGGRIAGAIHPAIGVAGVGLGVTLAFNGAITNPIFYLILASGAWSTGRRMLGYEQVVEGF